MPAIPEQFTLFGSNPLSKQLLIMVLFALLMLGAAISLIRKKTKERTDVVPENKLRLPGLVVSGIGIGLVTGLLGAGGGFLLIPALVLLVKLPMKEAIGTSLLIIALNSLIGFTGDLGQHRTDWRLLLTLSFLAIAGIFVGGLVARKIPGDKLRVAFG